MTNLFSLDGRTVLVTGASSGLGRHFALTLARAGADVSVAARRLDKLQEVVSRIEKIGRRAVAVEMDVTDGEGIHRAVEQAEHVLGPIHVLVNNAGVALPKPVLENDENDWDYIVGTNLKGAFFVAREVARHMVERGQGGNIINNASAVAFKVSKGLATYGAAKAGLVHLTQSLALELARDNIRVNALAPGYVETDMNRSFFKSGAGEKVVERIPCKRVGELSELDGPLLLLASDASKYMTGSVIVVDGGLKLN